MKTRSLLIALVLFFTFVQINLAEEKLDNFSDDFFAQYGYETTSEIPPEILSLAEAYFDNEFNDASNEQIQELIGQFENPEFHNPRFQEFLDKYGYEWRFIPGDDRSLAFGVVGSAFPANVSETSIISRSALSPDLQRTTKANIRVSGDLLHGQDASFEFKNTSTSIIDETGNTPTFAEGIFACESIEASGNVLIDSYDSINGFYNEDIAEKLALIRAGYLVDIRGSVNVGGSVVLDPDAEIVTKGKKINIENNVTTATAVKTCEGLSGVSQRLAYAQSINSAMYLEETELGNNPFLNESLHLFIGDGDSITLPAGKYYFEAITVEGSGTIFTDGIAKIYSNGQLILTDNASINHDGIATQFQYFNLEDNTEAVLDFGGNSSFTGVIYTPNTTLAIQGSASLSGAIHVGRLLAQGNVQIHQDDAAIDVVPPAVTITPADQSTIISTPINVLISYNDAEVGIDLDSLKISLNGEDITNLATILHDEAILSLDFGEDSPLKSDSNKLYVTISDYAGNTTTLGAIYKVFADGMEERLTNTMEFLKASKDIFGFAEDLSDLVIDVEKSSESTFSPIDFISVQQEYEGLQVMNAGMVVWSNTEDNTILGAIGNYVTDIVAPTIPVLNEEDIAAIIKNDLNDPNAMIGSLELVIFTSREYESDLAYRGYAGTSEIPGIYYVLSAISGEIYYKQHIRLDILFEKSALVFLNNPRRDSYNTVVRNLSSTDLSDKPDVTTNSICGLYLVIPDWHSYDFINDYGALQGSRANVTSDHADGRTYGRVERMVASNTFPYFDFLLNWEHEPFNDLHAAETNVYYHLDIFGNKMRSKFNYIFNHPRNVFDSGVIPAIVNINMENAQYCGMLDGNPILRFGIMDDTDSQGNPINLALDSTVIAHELGHAINDDISNSTMYDFSFHEGSADFWSYLLTGIVSVGEYGLPSERQRRLSSPDCYFGTDVDQTSPEEHVGGIPLAQSLYDLYHYYLPNWPNGGDSSSDIKTATEQLFYNTIESLSVAGFPTYDQYQTFLSAMIALNDICSSQSWCEDLIEATIRESFLRHNVVGGGNGEDRTSTINKTGYLVHDENNASSMPRFTIKSRISSTVTVQFTDTASDFYQGTNRNIYTANPLNLNWHPSSSCVTSVEFDDVDTDSETVDQIWTDAYSMPSAAVNKYRKSGQTVKIYYRVSTLLLGIWPVYVSPPMYFKIKYIDESSCATTMNQTNNSIISIAIMLFGLLLLKRSRNCRNKS